ncbi:MAG: hypothetical protein K2L22_03180 [Muribaculaceae bacterium]|nr:hypothetical protein [Muribaculaceae bacterium]
MTSGAPVSVKDIRIVGKGYDNDESKGYADYGQKQGFFFVASPVYPEEHIQKPRQRQYNSYILQEEQRRG